MNSAPADEKARTLMLEALGVLDVVRERGPGECAQRIDTLIENIHIAISSREVPLKYVYMLSTISGQLSNALETSRLRETLTTGVSRMAASRLVSRLTAGEIRAAVVTILGLLSLAFLFGRYEGGWEARRETANLESKIHQGTEELSRKETQLLNTKADLEREKEKRILLEKRLQHITLFELLLNLDGSFVVPSGQNRQQICAGLKANVEEMRKNGEAIIYTNPVGNKTHVEFISTGTTWVLPNLD